MAEPIWHKFLTERDKAVFAAGGFGARAGFGKRPALTRATRGGPQPSRHPALFLARGIRRRGLVTRQLGWLERSGAIAVRLSMLDADGAIPKRRHRQPSPFGTASQRHGRPRRPAGGFAKQQRLERSRSAAA